jgi:hypothetical protein
MCLGAVVYLSGTRRISAVLLDFHHSNCQTSAIAGQALDRPGADA